MLLCSGFWSDPAEKETPAFADLLLCSGFFLYDPAEKDAAQAVHRTLVVPRILEDSSTPTGPTCGLAHTVH